jgi:hypothetical protein
MAQPRARDIPKDARTLDELFPGKMGRLQFVRIMLRLRIPGLHEIRGDQRLDPKLLATLRRAIEEEELG